MRDGGVDIRLTRAEWEEVLVWCSMYAELDDVAKTIKEALRNDDKIQHMD